MQLIFILALMGADPAEPIEKPKKEAVCEQENLEEKKKCEMKEKKKEAVKCLETWDEAIEKLKQVQQEQKKLEETKTID